MWLKRGVFAIAIVSIGSIPTHADDEVKILFRSWQEKLVVAFDASAHEHVVAFNGSSHEDAELRGKVAVLDFSSGKRLQCAPAGAPDEKAALHISSDGIAIVPGAGNHPTTAVDLTSGAVLWANLTIGNEVRLGKAVLLGQCFARVYNQDPCLLDIRTGQPVVDLRGPITYRGSVPFGTGVVSVDSSSEKRLDYYTGAKAGPTWQFANEWGKAAIDSLEPVGHLLAFHQDGNTYLLNEEGKLIREIKESIVTSLPNQLSAYAISPGKTIARINPDTAEPEWSVQISSLMPKVKGPVHYGIPAVQDLVVTSDFLIVKLKQTPEQECIPIHDKQGRIVDCKANPTYGRVIALNAADGKIAPQTAALDRLSVDADLRFVGYSGGARYHPVLETSLSRVPVDYGELLWDNRGYIQYVDIKSGLPMKFDLPANPVYTDGLYAFIWNDNNETVYAYRYPDWAKGKEIWKSSKSSWACAGQENQTPRDELDQH